MPVSYAWRSGARVSLDAQTTGEALAKIERAHNGLVEPEMIVEAARSERSPLHAHFEWDDGKAADLYRVDQARELIRSITVDISRSNVEPRYVRGFVNVQVGDDRGYASTMTAMSSADLRKQVIEKAWSELEAWRERHAELVELGRIFSAIDQEREARPPKKPPAKKPE